MIFICSHNNVQEYTLPEEYMFLPLSALTGEDNINHKVSYRHLRHIYWIWKHMSYEEITIYQRKRYLSVHKIPDNYDAVVPQWQKGVGRLSIAYQWKVSHMTCPDSSKDMYMEKLAEIAGDEYKVFMHLDPCPTPFYHNIFSLKWNNFDSYCYYMFSILNDLEKEIGMTTNEELPLYAYLAERLSNFWFYKYLDINRIFQADLVVSTK